MLDKLNAGIAYNAFFYAFKDYIPNLELINDSRDVKKYDLIIFPGGEDINPRMYYEENMYSSYNNNRDDIESEIFDEASHFGKKMLGVCRGHQLINAKLGGRLVQDILFCGYPPHRGGHNLRYHSSNSLTKYIVGDNKVNSMHHQGVIYNGKNLNATSSFENIIESSESSNIYSVQFHPEFMGGELGLRFFETIALWVLDRDKLLKLIVEEKNKQVKQDANTSSTTSNYSSTTSTSDWTIRLNPEVLERMERAREEINRRTNVNVHEVDFTEDNEELHDEDFIEDDEEFDDEDN